jgi:hypothetical protein
MKGSHKLLVEAVTSCSKPLQRRFILSGVAKRGSSVMATYLLSNLQNCWSFNN